MIALATAKASPGATTFGLAAVAALTPGYGLLAEVDPAGGDVAVWAQTSYQVEGLIGLAAAGRRGMTPELLAGHERSVGPGLAVLLGPADGAQAAAVLTTTGALLAGVLAARPGAVLADCGRFSPGSPASPVLAAARTTVVVLRPEPAEIEHARSLLPALRAVAGDVVAVVVGRKPASAGEVAALLGAEVVGVVERDPRSAQALTRTGNAKALRRSPLVRSAASVLDRLAERAKRPELRAAG